MKKVVLIFLVVALCGGAIIPGHSQSTPQQAPFRLVTDLVDEMVRLQITCDDWDTSGRDAKDAADRFQRFWEKFQQSALSDRLFRETQFVSFRADIDSFATSAARYANAKIDHDESLRRTPDINDNEAIRKGFEISSKKIEASTALKRAWNAVLKERYFDKLDSTYGVAKGLTSSAYLYLFGIPVWSAPTKEVYFCQVTPDPAWPKSCVLATRLIPPNGSAMHLEHNKSEWERYRKGLRPDAATWNESWDAVALAKKGWTVFAVRAKGGDWTDVRDWRIFDSEARRLLGKEEWCDVQLLVGPERDRAKAVDVKIGFPPDWIK